MAAQTTNRHDDSIKQQSSNQYITILPTTVIENDCEKQSTNHQYAEISIPSSTDSQSESNSTTRTTDDDIAGYSKIDPVQAVSNELSSLSRRRMSLGPQYFHTTTTDSSSTMNSGIDVHRNRRMSLGPQFYHRSGVSSSLKSKYPTLSRDIYSSSENDTQSSSVEASHHSAEASIKAVSPKSQHRSRSETYSGLFRKSDTPYCYYKPTMNNGSHKHSVRAGVDTEILLRTLRLCGVSFSIHDRPDSPE